MKTVGIIGGIGPASTLDYYKGIIEGYRGGGGVGYPEIVIYSVNMSEMLGFVASGDLDGLTDFLLRALEKLKLAGADFAAIASNTPHIVRKRIKEVSPLPIIDIVDETCTYAAKTGVKKAVVLGTAFTMSSGLYDKALSERGIDALVPDQEGQRAVHGIIFPNLEDGIVLAEDKTKILALSQSLLDEAGADAVVLGCTELPLIIKKGDLDCVILNTAEIHIAAIVNKILEI